ncbi:Uncharacterised protein [Escherichia coli]|nr:Uncharacterised protein [Escherichia coli]
MGFISQLFNLLTSRITSAKTMTPSSLHELTANITPKLKKQNGNISIENDWLTIDSPYFLDRRICLQTNIGL